jgi:hypothetical protein
VAVNDYQLNARYINYWGHVCPTGRHTPSHPGDTCDEIDEWIALRDRILGDMIRKSWEQFEREFQNSYLAGTAFAVPAEPAPEIPDKPVVDQALAILRPHLAWDHRYRDQP